MTSTADEAENRFAGEIATWNKNQRSICLGLQLGGANYKANAKLPDSDLLVDWKPATHDNKGINISAPLP